MSPWVVRDLNVSDTLSMRMQNGDWVFSIYMRMIDIKNDLDVRAFRTSNRSQREIDTIKEVTLKVSRIHRLYGQA